VSAPRYQRGGVCSAASALVARMVVATVAASVTGSGAAASAAATAASAAVVAAVVVVAGAVVVVEIVVGCRCGSGRWRGRGRRSAAPVFVLVFVGRGRVARRRRGLRYRRRIGGLRCVGGLGRLGFLRRLGLVRFIVRSPVVPDGAPRFGRALATVVIACVRRHLSGVRRRVGPLESVVVGTQRLPVCLRRRRSGQTPAAVRSLQGRRRGSGRRARAQLSAGLELDCRDRHAARSAPVDRNADSEDADDDEGEDRVPHGPYDDRSVSRHRPGGRARLLPSSPPEFETVSSFTRPQACGVHGEVSNADAALCIGSGSPPLSVRRGFPPAGPLTRARPSVAASRR
jgi:hypothetical protein